MATMGSTGTINVSPEMMQAVLTAVGDCRTTFTSLNSRLEGIMTGLIPGNFSGSAANSVKAFYENKIKEATVTSAENIFSILEKVANGINSAIPLEEGVDEKIAAEIQSLSEGDN